MKVFMLWNGGSSYAPANPFEAQDIEVFPSIDAAIDDFESRLYSAYYPCVERETSENGGPSAWLCIDNPYQNGDLMPDYVMEFGPRGGVHVVRT